MVGTQINNDSQLQTSGHHLIYFNNIAIWIFIIYLNFKIKNVINKIKQMETITFLAQLIFFCSNLSFVLPSLINPHQIKPPISLKTLHI